MAMRRILATAAAAAALMAPCVANATVYDWMFAAPGISGSGALEATPLGGGEYFITGGSGTVTDSVFGAFSISLAPCASPVCTFVDVDGAGANVTWDNLLWPGDPIGAQLDNNGVLLEPGPPGSGALALNVWDFPSQEFYNYTSPNGYQNLTTPFNVTPVAGIPEVPTWAMLAVGFAGLSLAGFGKTRTARAIAC